MDLNQIRKQVINICQLASARIKEKRGSSSVYTFSEKEQNSLVTEIDIWTEQFLISELSEIIPEASILAEEGFSNEKINGLQWIIDPIDGTTNMIYNIPPYAISIALVEEGTPLIGVVYELYSNECYSAYLGGGAFMNETTIQTHNCSSISNAIVATGFPYSIEPKPDEYLSIIQHFVTHARGVRRHGAASVDLAYLAAGKFSLYYEINLNPWDVAAGILIVKEAGGEVGSFSYYNNPPLTGQSIIASSKGVFEEALTCINSIYGT